MKWIIVITLLLVVQAILYAIMKKAPSGTDLFGEEFKD
jgi:hypothetical protein